MNDAELADQIVDLDDRRAVARCSSGWSSVIEPAMACCSAAARRKSTMNPSSNRAATRRDLEAREGTIRRLVPCSDKPHSAAFRNRVDHLGSSSKRACRLRAFVPGRRIGQERPAGRQLAHLVRPALRQHLALVQHDDVPAAFGFVQVRRARAAPSAPDREPVAG